MGKISKKEKDERILWKKNEVAEYEATTFSIFYNNSLFLALVILASFYILSGTSAQMNDALSIGLSSGLIALLSTGTQNWAGTAQCFTPVINILHVFPFWAI